MESEYITSLVHPMYMGIDELKNVLCNHRILLVLNFIRDTAKDALEDQNVCARVPLYGYMTFKKLSNEKLIDGIKARSKDVREVTLRALYTLFLACRYMTKEDKIIVMTNFSYTRISNE